MNNKKMPSTITINSVNNNSCTYAKYLAMLS